MQRPDTGAIRTEIKPSKPKRQTNSQNTKRTYCQTSEQPTGCHPATQTEHKII